MRILHENKTLPAVRMVWGKRIYQNFRKFSKKVYFLNEIFKISNIFSKFVEKFENLLVKIEEISGKIKLPDYSC